METYLSNLSNAPCKLAQLVYPTPVRSTVWSWEEKSSKHISKVYATLMCNPEKHVLALMQLWSTQISRRWKKKGHMEAMDPTSCSCRTLRDNRQCLFTLQRRDEQLVLIIGLIFRRKRRWGGGLSSAPTWTSYSFALDVRQCWPLLLTTSPPLHPPVSCYLASNILSGKEPINFLTLQRVHVCHQGVSGVMCRACNGILAVTEWQGIRES